MFLANIFEALMLIAFGAAWPFSIYHAYKTREYRGKSQIFLIILIVGYICGIVHKLVLWPDGNYVLLFYCLNLGLVTIDLCIYHRNKRFASQKKPN